MSKHIIKVFPPNTFEFRTTGSITVCEGNEKDLYDLSISIMEQLENAPIYEFALKVAKAMKEVASSNVYFIMQQAFGEIDWNECEGIWEEILRNDKTTQP